MSVVTLNNSIDEVYKGFSERNDQVVVKGA